MRKVLGVTVGDIGVIGLLCCVVAIVLSWRTALRSVDRVDRVSTRLDQRLSDADTRLAEVERRTLSVTSELEEIHRAAKLIAAEDLELPRVRAALERLLDRFVPLLERAETIAVSLRSLAAWLLAVADLIEQLRDRPEVTEPIRTAAEAIDSAAVTLTIPRAKLDEIKLSATVRLSREFISLLRNVLLSSELLKKGLALSREQIAEAREATLDLRKEVVIRVYAVAGISTLFWSWGGLGQGCLIGWGRRLFRRQPASV